MNAGRRRRWHPTPVLLLGKSHGQRSLVGCGPWGLEELDRTERLPFHFSFMHWRRKWQPTLVFLAWRIPGTGEPGGLLSMGSHRVGHDWSDLASAAVNAGIVEVMLFLRVAPETPCSVSTSTPAWGPGTGFSQPETLLGIWDTHPARAGDLILYLKNFYLGAISSLSFMGYYEASKLLLL